LTLLITSAAYSQPDFISIFGLLPPAFLPVANKRLYEQQSETLTTLDCPKLLSIPENFEVGLLDLQKLERLGLELVKIPVGLPLGESIAVAIKKFIGLDGDLRILHGDTLLLKFPVDMLDIISIGETNEYYSWAKYDLTENKTPIFTDGLLSGSAENSPFGKRLVLSGYFSFSQTQEFLDSLEKSNYNFIKSLNIYSETNALKPIQEGEWLDFGHLDQYYRSRSQLTTERKFNKLSISRRTVKKSSSIKYKIIAEAEWYENLPKELQIYTPKLLGKFSNSGISGYETEYLYLTPLSDLATFGRLPNYVWQRIFQCCDDFLLTAKKFKPEQELKNLDQLFLSKTQERLLVFGKESGIDLSRSWRLGDNQIPSISKIAEDAASCIPRSSHNFIQVIHGDFCFSNILYDFRANIIKLIDPRGIMPEETPTIFGDVRYDIAKLYHSVIGCYDLIVSGYYEINHFTDYSVDLTLPTDLQLQQRQEIFKERSFADLSITEACAHPISILLFLSMLPLHADNEDRQTALLANAFRLYLELDK
jgi:hypothetical protein